MAWIKRNLFFLIGSLVALALMIGGVIFLFQQVSAEKDVADKIAAQYAELKRLYTQNPHPGVGAIDNIKTARDEEAQLRGYTKKIHPLFEPIPPIPDSGTNKVSNADFATELRNTVAELHHDADQQSVILSSNYYFTFEAQKNLMVFDPASLQPMAVHLGEIKALCEILFDAKVNTLDGIRRERISDSNDINPPDYLPTRTVTNNLAELTPYEVTFKSFSAELALVLANLASSPNGFIVKTINVEPVISTGEDQQPMYVLPPPPDYNRPGGTRIPRGEQPSPVAVTPLNRQSVFLNERPFKVTLSIIVVKQRLAK